jgi:hypothetical protein
MPLFMGIALVKPEHLCYNHYAAFLIHPAAFYRTLKSEYSEEVSSYLGSGLRGAKQELPDIPVLLRKTQSFDPLRFDN